MLYVHSKPASDFLLGSICHLVQKQLTLFYCSLAGLAIIIKASQQQEHLEDAVQLADT